jgi:hypothetical protein
VQWRAVDSEGEVLEILIQPQRDNAAALRLLRKLFRDIGTDAIEWVKRYIDLAPEVRPHCDIAIERLNLARRRLSPGNKAIEGAIYVLRRFSPMIPSKRSIIG